MALKAAGPDNGSAPDSRLRAAGRIALAFLVAGAGAATFLFLKLPLPWFLGPLTFCLAASVLHAPIERPALLTVPTRIVLGVTIGTAFTPALLAQIGGMAASLSIVVPFTIAIAAAGMLFFERVVRLDKPTAFFCAVPGGLTDMVVIAQDAGADTRTVTLVQAARILLLVFLLPFWLQWTTGHRTGGLPPHGTWSIETTLADASVLIALGWGGWLLARRLGLAGAALVGPMVLSGLAHVLGLTPARVPIEVVNFAQITIGILLGAQFRGLTLNELTSTLAWGAAFAMGLLAATALLALLAARLTGFDATTLLLAYAPGGQTEINLLAYVLGFDVAFTALHHLVRLAVVIFGVQIVLKLVRRRLRPPDAR
ncbi:MAG: AbrB family transcriptional regulator [Hyphomicrobiaceae bacterium]